MKATHVLMVVFCLLLVFPQVTNAQKGKRKSKKSTTYWVCYYNAHGGLVSKDGPFTEVIASRKVTTENLKKFGMPVATYIEARLPCPKQQMN